MSENENSRPERGESKFEGVCDHCGPIEFDEQPEGEFGPTCPGCGDVLRVVSEVEPDNVRESAALADELRKARETLEMLDDEFEHADHARKSEMVKEAANV
ncbi:hypothetical protein [Halobellus sp. H-GB7]|uniref:hypothetical protein n=1 Tax=Halobellus sp. H-GB7 TaxID=3069756 RepID=UPI0027AF8851|nr:hypothetical protein [Halobellus sp. H-GB7]MDQ2054307.1 hypothetical protein [Halobellus sp. H-GB7]